MYRATGAGKLKVILDKGVGSLEALLYNFDFDDFNGRQFRPLKVEHTKFLDEKVLGLLANHRSTVWLQGRASRIGTNARNLETSMTRAGRAKAYVYDTRASRSRLHP